MQWIIFGAVLVLALVLWLASQRLRQQTALPSGEVIYNDTRFSDQPVKLIVSKRLGLAGKPDYLLRNSTQIIPFEIKSTLAPAQPYANHVTQVIAYCILVQEEYGQRPEYGFIKYADRQFKIDFTPAREQALLQTLENMRACRAGGVPPARSHQSAAKCRGCGQKAVCDQQLNV